MDWCKNASAGVAPVLPKKEKSSGRHDISGAKEGASVYFGSGTGLTTTGGPCSVDRTEYNQHEVEFQRAPTPPHPNGLGSESDSDRGSSGVDAVGHSRKKEKKTKKKSDEKKKKKKKKEKKEKKEEERQERKEKKVLCHCMHCMKMKEKPSPNPHL